MKAKIGTLGKDQFILELRLEDENDVEVAKELHRRYLPFLNAVRDQSMDFRSGTKLELIINQRK